MRLAISGQLLSQTTPLPLILDVLRDLGVNAIELWPENVPDGDSTLVSWRYADKDVAGTRRLLDANGMSVACVTVGWGILPHAATEGTAAATAALEDAIDAAACLGAPLVNCYLNGLASARFIDIVRPAAAYAGERGVTVVLENEAHDDSGSSTGVRAIVDAVASPHFGTVYDPCNYYQANEEPYPAAYEVLASHIRYVHLKGGCWFRPDAQTAAHKGGTLREREDEFIGYVAIPDGAVNADGVLVRLARDGYAGFVTLEPHVAAERALDYYRIEVPYVRARLDGAPAVREVAGGSV